MTSKYFLLRNYTHATKISAYVSSFVFYKSHKIINFSLPPGWENTRSIIRSERGRSETRYYNFTLRGVRAARNFNSNNKRRTVKMRFKSARKLLKNIMIKLTEGVPPRSLQRPRTRRASSLLVGERLCK